MADVSGEIENWPAVQATIEAFPKHLQDAVRERLRDLGDDIAADARSKVLQSPPTHGNGKRWGEHRSRQLTAAGISSDVKADGADASVTVKVDPSGLGPARAAFPFAYNTAEWAHPVFGGATQVNQQGRPYLDAEQLVSRNAQRVESDMAAALTEAADTIKG